HLLVLLAAAAVVVSSKTSLPETKPPLVAIHPRLAPPVLPLAPPETRIPRALVPEDNPPEPVIPDKDGEESDKNREATHEDGDGMRGDSPDAVLLFHGLVDGLRGQNALEVPGAYDVLGPGGGSGSARRFGNDAVGGRRNTRSVPRGTVGAVREGLRWLAR